MVKLRETRVGEKFVFGREGGVWESLGGSEARCVWGPRRGATIRVNADVMVYVIFKRERDTKSVPAPMDANHGITVVIESGDGVIKRIEHASAAMVTAYANADVLSVIPEGKRKEREFMVTDSGFHHERMEMNLLVKEG